jgi:hypothetical protein
VAEPTNSFHTERTINLFIHNVKDPYFDNKIVKAFHKPLKNAAALPEDVAFSGNIHCKVALVLFIEWSEQGGDASLWSLISVHILHPSIYIKLMSCTGYKSQHNHNIETVLPWLLGDLKHIEG